MSKSNTHKITLVELRSIIREAIINEKIGGEKIKGWKPPWQGGGQGGDRAPAGYGGMDMEDMMYGLGGYEKEIAGERMASYGANHGDDGPFDDGDDDDDGDDGGDD